jgi:hypothetical protein
MLTSHFHKLFHLNKVTKVSGENNKVTVLIWDVLSLDFSLEAEYNV